jgi:hypothetical protein
LAFATAADEPFDPRAAAPADFLAVSVRAATVGGACFDACARFGAGARFDGAGRLAGAFFRATCGVRGLGFAAAMASVA